MGDRIIQESKTISRKNLIKNLIDMCDVNIYKLEKERMAPWYWDITTQSDDIEGIKTELEKWFTD